MAGLHAPKGIQFVDNGEHFGSNNTSTEVEFGIPADDASINGDSAEADELNAEFAALQEILVGSYRRSADALEVEIGELQVKLENIQRTINDKQALIDTMTPIVATSIQQSISDSKEEMIEALYPIMGRLVSRSVTESMRDLIQRIDSQMRRTLSFGTVIRPIRARLLGVSDAELALREALPFQIHDLFLIHRETGLLLQHVSTTSVDGADSDLISGMLTAIGDFVQDAFGQSDEDDLDQIQYGETTILIEAAQRVYLAAVTEGFPPQSFRADMRQRIYQIEQRFGTDLRDFSGDTSHFADTKPLLDALVKEESPIAADQPTATNQRQSLVRTGQFILGVTLIIFGFVVLGWILTQVL